MAGASATIRVVPASPADVPVWVFDAVAEIEAVVFTELFGNDDLADTAEQLRAAYRNQRYAKNVYVIALDPGSAGIHGLPERLGPAAVLGFGLLELPMEDNLDQSFVDVAVRPSARGTGIGSSIEGALSGLAHEHGRHTAMGFTVHPGQAGPDGVAAPTGAGLVSRDAAASFALGRGYRLEQTERHSVLAVPAADVLAAHLSRAAECAGADYDVVDWFGPTPEEYLDQMAELYRRMSVDVPMGGLRFEEESWDADRVRDADSRSESTGKRAQVTAARHRASGALVAFTLLRLPDAKPAVAYQDQTLVHGDHRGHHLGMLVKAANLRQAVRLRSALRRVHTWNAEENRHMLSINEELGFARASTAGAWQRVEDDR